jgi:hypothetical protein
MIAPIGRLWHLGMVQMHLTVLTISKFQPCHASLRSASLCLSSQALRGVYRETSQLYLKNLSELANCGQFAQVSVGIEPPLAYLTCTVPLLGSAKQLYV